MLFIEAKEQAILSSRDATDKLDGHEPVRLP
jgi:hypothetical protein